MPYVSGTPGQVFHTSWIADDPVAGAVFLHGFDEQTGLYDRCAADLADLTIPVLLVHGEAEQAAPWPATLAASEPLPQRITHVVSGGRHDILNDVTHAEVAAVIGDFVLSRVGPAAAEEVGA